MVRRSSVIIAATLAVLSLFEPALCYAGAAPPSPRGGVDERPRFIRKHVKRFVFGNSTTPDVGGGRAPFGVEQTETQTHDQGGSSITKAEPQLTITSSSPVVSKTALSSSSSQPSVSSAEGGMFFARPASSQPDTLERDTTTGTGSSAVQQTTSASSPGPSSSSISPSSLPISEPGIVDLSAFLSADGPLSAALSPVLSSLADTLSAANLAAPRLTSGETLVDSSLPTSSQSGSSPSTVPQSDLSWSAPSQSGSSQSGSVLSGSSQSSSSQSDTSQSGSSQSDSSQPGSLEATQNQSVQSPSVPSHSVQSQLTASLSSSQSQSGSSQNINNDQQTMGFTSTNSPDQVVSNQPTFNTRTSLVSRSLPSSNSALDLKTTSNMGELNTWLTDHITDQTTTEPSNPLSDNFHTELNSAISSATQPLNYKTQDRQPSSGADDVGQTVSAPIGAGAVTAGSPPPATATDAQSVPAVPTSAPPSNEPNSATTSNNGKDASNAPEASSASASAQQDNAAGEVQTSLPPNGVNGSDPQASGHSVNGNTASHTTDGGTSATDVVGEMTQATTLNAVPSSNPTDVSLPTSGLQSVSTSLPEGTRAQTAGESGSTIPSPPATSITAASDMTVALAATNSASGGGSDSNLAAIATSQPAISSAVSRPTLTGEGQTGTATAITTTSPEGIQATVSGATTPISQPTETSATVATSAASNGTDASAATSPAPAGTGTSSATSTAPADTDASVATSAASNGTDTSVTSNPAVTKTGAELTSASPASQPTVPISTTLSNGQVVPLSSAGILGPSTGGQAAPATTTGSQPTSTVAGSAPSESVVGPTAGPIVTQPQVYPSQGKGPFSQMPTGYDDNTVQMVPTSILFYPSSSLPTPTSGSNVATGLPSNVPLVLYPPSGPVKQPENTELIRIAFLYPLNYDFVWRHEESQRQIFTFLPRGIAYGLGIDLKNVTVQTLRAWDNSLDNCVPVCYVTTLALAWIPSQLVDRLGLSLRTTSDKFYHNPDPSVNTLLGMVNNAIPVRFDNETDGTTATFGSPPSSSASSSAGAAPVGGNIANTSPVKVSSVVIGVGVVCGAAAYGAAMFFVARRYRKRRQSHMRSPSIFPSPIMSHAGPDPAAGAALMSGAMGGERSVSPYYDRTESRGSGRSGGSSGRQQISAPVMAENSLGWN
ncbi:MAG: hypothetical protein Q9163_004276 [Psora crenata]